MSIRVLTFDEPPCVHLADHTPRVQRMVTLLLRDAALINACDSGSVELHFSRNAGEHVSAKIILFPPR